MKIHYQPNEHQKRFLYDLTLAFIVLKLCAVIGWNWLLVLAPLWGPELASIINGMIDTINRRRGTR